MHMTSSIIGDAKYQELNMSFAFDQQYQDKLIINALVQHNSYQLQVNANPDLDFQDLKTALISKQFKLTSKTPEILKIKIGIISFQFKSLEKLTLNILKQTIADLSNKLKQQTLRNTFLEGTVNQLKTSFDEITTKMADMNRLNDERNQHYVILSKGQTELMKKYEQCREQIQKQKRENKELLKIQGNEQKMIIEVRRQLNELKEREDKEAEEIIVLKQKISKNQNQGKILRQQLSHLTIKTQTQEQKLTFNKRATQDNKLQINNLKSVDEKIQQQTNAFQVRLLKVETKLNQIQYKYSQVKPKYEEEEEQEDDGMGGLFD